MDRSRWVRWFVGSCLVMCGAVACAGPVVADDSDAPKDPTDDDRSSQTTPPSSTRPPTQSATAPTLTRIDPASLPIGTTATPVTLTLTGTNFSPTARVGLDNSVLTAVVTSATSITFTVPQDRLLVAGTLQISVLSGSPEERSNTISVPVGSAPGAGQGSLLSLSPTSAPQGSASLFVTVTGSNFDSLSTVVFNGRDVPTLFIGATSIRGTVPSDLLVTPGTVSVSVRQNGTITGSLPFVIGGNGSSTCSRSCLDFGLSPGQCRDMNPLPFDFGGIFAQWVQCGFDGCVRDGCID